MKVQIIALVAAIVLGLLYFMRRSANRKTKGR